MNKVQPKISTVSTSLFGTSIRLDNVARSDRRQGWTMRNEAIASSTSYVNETHELNIARQSIHVGIAVAELQRHIHKWQCSSAYAYPNLVSYILFNYDQ